MTTAVNPYASPQTADLDNDKNSEEVSAQLFSFSGRLGRLRLITYGIISAFVVMFVAGLAAAILIPVNPVFAVFIYGAVVLSSAVYGFSLYIQRLHDLNQSGWWALLMFVPLLNLALLIYLLFFPGTKGSNRYGSPVKRNSTGVIVAFLISVFLGIAYIGMVAAIAIPAYQDYVERAQQVN